jgi:hypothetical protein
VVANGAAEDKEDSKEEDIGVMVMATVVEDVVEDQEDNIIGAISSVTECITRS